MAASNFKIVILGNSGVGKTSILQRYVLDKFSEKYVATIGVDWFEKSAFVTSKSHEEEVELMLWDTTGEERFKSLALSYCKDASVAILVFDMEDAESLEDLRLWKSEAEQAQAGVHFLLAGNKCDRVCQIEPSKIDEDRISLGCLEYHEVSALTGLGITGLFEAAAQLAFDTQGLHHEPQVITEEPEVHDHGRGCC